MNIFFMEAMNTMLCMCGKISSQQAVTIYICKPSFTERKTSSDWKSLIWTFFWGCRLVEVWWCELGIRKISLFRHQYLQGLVVDGVDGVALDDRLLLALARLVWQEVALHIPAQTGVWDRHNFQKVSVERVSTTYCSQFSFSTQNRTTRVCLEWLKVGHLVLIQRTIRERKKKDLFLWQSPNELACWV